MTVRGIKALNTSAGLSNYIVAAVGMPHEVCIITKAFDEGFDSSHSHSQAPTDLLKLKSPQHLKAISL